MDGEGASGGKMDMFNASIRAICVLVLLGGFTFAFVWGVFTSKLIVSSDAYIGVLTSALVWWFKSRDDQQAQASVAAGTAATIAAVTGTGSGGTAGPAAATQMAAAETQKEAAKTQLDAAKREERG